MRYLLDTNICIYAIKNRPASVLAALRAHAPAGLGISSISVAELFFGAEKSGSARNRDALRHFLEPLEIADFDRDAAQAYGTLRHALALDVILVTNNTREFARVPGLKLENWAEAG